jgi:hypothetical protein
LDLERKRGDADFWEGHPDIYPNIHWHSLFAHLDVQNTKYGIKTEDHALIEPRLWKSAYVDWLNGTLYSGQFETVRAEFSSIEVHTVELLQIFGSVELIAMGTPTPPPKACDPKPQKGRRSGYEWKAFYAELAVRADLDGLPETQAQLERQMAEWCLQNWDKQPSESTIRDLISPIYRHPRKAGKADK